MNIFEISDASWGARRNASKTSDHELLGFRVRLGGPIPSYSIYFPFLRLAVLDPIGDSRTFIETWLQIAGKSVNPYIM